MTELLTHFQVWVDEPKALCGKVGARMTCPSFKFVNCERCLALRGFYEAEQSKKQI